MFHKLHSVVHCLLCRLSTYRSYNVIKSYKYLWMLPSFSLNSSEIFRNRSSSCYQTIEEERRLVDHELFSLLFLQSTIVATIAIVYKVKLLWSLQYHYSEYYFHRLLSIVGLFLKWKVTEEQVVVADPTD